MPSQSPSLSVWACCDSQSLFIRLGVGIQRVEFVSRRDGPLYAVGEGNRVQGDGEVEEADEGQERWKLRHCHTKTSKPNGVWQRQNNRVHDGHYRGPRYDSKRGRNREVRRDSPPPSLRDTL